MNDRRQAESPAGREAALLDYVERLKRHAVGRRAVHIRLSALQPYHRREHHVRVAVNSFENLVRALDCRIFLLTNNDIVFVGKDVTVSEIDAAVLKLRFLFDEDPIVHTPDHGRDGFCAWFDLGVDYKAFLDRCLHLAAEIKQQRPLSDDRGAAASVARPLAQPLTPRDLGKIEDAIRRADLANFVRRQPICLVAPGAPATPVFRELYVSIADLAQSVAPQIDLTSNRWLFQNLTESLDLRMLAFQTRNTDSRTASRFSLNLNIRTLMSPEFLAFDGAVNAGARGTIILELQAVDLFADPATYFFARDFVRERGYKICLDGVSPLVAGLMHRETLGFDFLKLVWSRELLSDPTGNRHAAVRALVDSAGAERIILCRCDDKEAVTVGQSLGLTLFQGRHVDTLMAAQSKPASLTLRQASALA